MLTEITHIYYPSLHSAFKQVQPIHQHKIRTGLFTKTKRALNNQPQTMFANPTEKTSYVQNDYSLLTSSGNKTRVTCKATITFYQKKKKKKIAVE